jgi:hypothetical protein
LSKKGQIVKPDLEGKMAGRSRYAAPPIAKRINGRNFDAEKSSV